MLVLHCTFEFVYFSRTSTRTRTQFASNVNVYTTRTTVRWAICASSLVLRFCLQNKSIIQQTCSQTATSPIATEQLLGSLIHAELADDSLPSRAISAARVPRDVSPALATTLSSRPLLSDSGIARESPVGASEKQQADTSEPSDTGTARQHVNIELMSVESEACNSENTELIFSRPDNAIRLVC